MKLDSENWRPIEGFEGYWVGRDGRVYSRFKKRALKPAPIKSGYLTLALRFKGKLKTFYVHRLVAQTWIPKPNEVSLVVDHIDGNKLNNSADNLRWVSAKQNINNPVTRAKADEKIRDSASVPVLQIDPTGNLVKRWPSISAAANFFGVHTSSIGFCSRGRTKTSCGFRWQYERESKPHQRSVHKLDEQGNILATFPSIKSAARSVGVTTGSLNFCLRGRTHTAGGHRWAYADSIPQHERNAVMEPSDPNYVIPAEVFPAYLSEWNPFPKEPEGEGAQECQLQSDETTLNLVVNRN